jgi:hypothetical protein
MILGRGLFKFLSGLFFKTGYAAKVAAIAVIPINPLERFITNRAVFSFFFRFRHI